jgi:hypothetical protein
MTDPWGQGVPDSAIIMLARLMLTRIKLSGMKVTTRQDATAIVKGLRPAVSKATPLTSVMQSAVGKKALELSRCSACGKPLQIGELCRTVWTMYDGEHIKCTGGTRCRR